MLASLGDIPFSNPDWYFEPKLDGYRAIALIQKGRSRLLSRRGRDIVTEYPYLIPSLSSQPAGIVLDGEIVALDDKGHPCFQCLQQHLELMRKKGQDAGISIIYYVFDLLYYDGYDLTGAPQVGRKELLETVLKQSDHVRYLDHFEGDGKTIFDAAVTNGFEGVVAKRRDSIYEPGRRSRNWIKIKAVQSDDFVIGGFSEGTGYRAGTFGALLLGYYDDRGRLVYAGHVGSGFDDAGLTELRQRLDGLRIPQRPFAEMPPLNAPTTWVRPELVAEVKFSQWTKEGYLRIPVFLRLRDDKAPEEVRRAETAVTVSERSYPDTHAPASALDGLVRRIEGATDSSTIDINGHRLQLTNLDKELWPAFGGRRALTKRDLIVYLAKVSPYLLPHLLDRPLTLKRYPDGIHGEQFYQKHWNNPVPEFVETVNLESRHAESGEYLLCNNLATLLWLGQIADIELHTWFSRVTLEPDLVPSGKLESRDRIANFALQYPDFVVFDLDPYIYSGKEARGDEPELNRTAFARTAEVALRLKEALDGLSLASFVKTSGRTGLHVYVPIIRRLDYSAVHAAARTVGLFLLQGHSAEMTLDWPVEKRTGKVFFDYNQNVQGKTLASIYSPRASPEASVSMAVSFDELGRVYPTDFTILTTPGRLGKIGDLWQDILKSKRDLKG